MKKIIIFMVLMLAAVVFVAGDEAWEFHMDQGSFLVNASYLDNAKVCSYYAVEGLVCNGTMTSGGDKWTIDYASLINDTNVLKVNDTYLSDFFQGEIATTFYNVSAISLTHGTATGDLADLQTYNSSSYVVTEAVGSPGMTIFFNFTGVTAFNEIIGRIKTDGNTQNVIVYLWDYDSLSWEEYFTYADVTAYQTFVLSVFDDTEHISGGVVQMMLNHSAAGNTGQKHYFDWVTIAETIGSFSAAESDPLSHHLNENLVVGAYNVTIGGGYLSGGIDLYSTGSAFFANDIFIGGDILSVTTQYINGSFLPNATNTFDLGSSSFKWKDGYFAGDVDVARLNTGQGDYELYAMNQDVETTDAVTFLNATMTQSTGSQLRIGNITISSNSSHTCLIGQSTLCIEN